MKRLTLFIMLTLVYSCQKKHEPYHLLDFGRVMHLTERPNGNYNVICIDGTIELDVTFDHLVADNVCLIPADPDNRPEPVEPDYDFDTGVPACLHNTIKNQFVTLYTPPKLKRALSDFGTSPITRFQDFVDLSDLMFRHIILSNGQLNLVDFNVNYKAYWDLIIQAISNETLMQPPSNKNKKELISYWLMIYRILYLNNILQNPTATNVLSDLGFDIFDTLHTIGGYNLSLNMIEKDILNPTDRDMDFNDIALSPEDRDPRIRLLLGLFTLSSFKSYNFYLRPESIDQIMTETLLIVANSEKNFYVEDAEFLIYPGYFFFYPNDTEILFGPNWQGLSSYIVDDCRNDKQLIDSIIPTGELYDDPFDWTLNVAR
ncbi:MAG: DUF547 domain-containing protein [Pseudobacteriovorax sp.]|nr:DUF547 domain-containing protein [Pseudobacteriovorax sp.]